MRRHVDVVFISWVRFGKFTNFLFLKLSPRAKGDDSKAIGQMIFKTAKSVRVVVIIYSVTSANAKPLEAIPLVRESKREFTSQLVGAVQTTIHLYENLLDLVLLFVEQSISPRFWRNSKNVFALRRPRFALIFGMIGCVVGSCWLVASVKCTLAGNLAQLSAVYK